MFFSLFASTTVFAARNVDKKEQSGEEKSFRSENKLGPEEGAAAQNCDERRVY